MSSLSVGLVSIVVLISLILVRCPIALAMAVVGFAGSAIIVGIPGASSILQTAPYEVLSNYNFSPIPMFILMGGVAARSGVSGDLFSAARSLFGARRGGLAFASMTASASFAAICGSSLATVATIGRVALPELKRHGYGLQFASGTVAAGGTLGIMIPPSIPLLLYALVTELSVSDMFIAGILPGLLGFGLYCCAIAYTVIRRPEQAPPGEATSVLRKIKDLRGAAPFMLLFFSIIGGIYAGIFTPTEAAAAGALMSILLGFARGMNFGQLWEVLGETLVVTCMIFFMLVGVQIFGFLLSVSRVANAAADIVTLAQLSPFAIILLILLLYIFLGCIMDGMAMMLLTVPVLVPVVTAAGFSPIWFGVFSVVTIELGLLTPPFGMNVFVMKSVDPDLSLRTVFKGVGPFITADLVRVILLILFPGIALMLL